MAGLERVGMTPEDRLAQVGLSLPRLADPVALYTPATREGNLVFVSGCGPWRDGSLHHCGTVGAGVTVDEGRQAAELVALNLLSVLAAELGRLSAVRRVVKLLVFVNSAPDFTEQHVVANAASSTLILAFGEDRGAHARSAVGMAALPNDMSVEIEGIFAVDA